MAGPTFLAVRHLQTAGRRIPVLLSRNEGGSVEARCLLGAGDTPIVDGATADEVLNLLADALEGLLLARRSRSAKLRVMGGGTKGGSGRDATAAALAGR